MMLKPIVGFGDTGDIGQAVQALISDNLSRLNTCFLAKIESLDENKVNVSFVMGDFKMVIPSLLVGVPQSKSLKLGMKLEVGDTGLCLVCDSDISTFAKTGSGGLSESKRSHDLIDSVFLPLSLFNSQIEENKIESEEDLEIKAKLLSLKSENSSLKESLSKLADILAGLKTIPAVQGSNLVLNPDVILEINQWKAELDMLLKE